jgi:hypothetical protein
MTEDNNAARRTVDFDEAARLVEALERDLAQLESGRGDIDRLRADVEQLRGALASAPAGDELHGGLAGLREKLHAVTDELLADALKTGDYIARIGRLLGL